MSRRSENETDAGAPFVTQLRSRDGVHDLSEGHDDAFLIRAQVHEAWDAIRVRVSANTPAAAVKSEAIRALLADTQPADDFVMKIGGTEVRDESRSLEALGVRAGSTVFLHGRRRRPVR